MPRYDYENELEYADAPDYDASEFEDEDVPDDLYQGEEAD